MSGMKKSDYQALSISALLLVIAICLPWIVGDFAVTLAVNMAMFTVLAQTAQNQQIIVLSCRTRAFSDLGGTRAAIRVGVD